MSTASSCGHKTRLYSLSSEGTLVLSKRSEDVEEKFPMRCVRIHSFRQRPKRGVVVAQAGDDYEQVGQKTAETIESPHHQRVAGLQEGEARFETGSIIPRAGNFVLEQVAGINAGGDQRIALQGRALSVAVERDAHVPSQQVRKTSQGSFQYSLPFRQYLSFRKAEPMSLSATRPIGVSESRCLPTEHTHGVPCNPIPVLLGRK